VADDNDRNLILDEIKERLRFLTADNEAQRDAALAELDVRSPRETTMVTELADRRVLVHPERFAESHRLLMRAMEVVARHGHHSPTLGNFGPFGFLKPVASWIIRLIARYISFSYLGNLIDSLRDLYGRRETQAAPGTPERALLRQARVEVMRLREGYKTNALGLPSFLFGALLVPAGASLGRLFGGFGALSTPVAWILTVAVVAVSLFASWVILRGAAMAHRRRRLAIRNPLEAVWETVGNCGKPPRDDAMTFAYVAIVLTIVGGVALPIVTGLVVLLT
jgi:hypothetical protein